MGSLSELFLVVVGLGSNCLWCFSEYTDVNNFNFQVGLLVNVCLFANGNAPIALQCSSNYLGSE
jgi:hypothetical protein